MSYSKRGGLKYFERSLLVLLNLRSRGRCDNSIECGETGCEDKLYLPRGECIEEPDEEISSIESKGTSGGDS